MITSQILEDGLPYFVRTELNKQMTQLRPFQKKFWDEAREAWNPASGGQVFKRLLMVAATGAGKSAMIAMAPFIGARERCIVVVPNLTILNALRGSLCNPEQLSFGDDAASDHETVPPALQKLGLLGRDQQMPRVLVLNDLPKMNKAGKYVYPDGTAARSLVKIVQDYEVVLTTAQTLVAESRKNTKKRKHGGDGDSELEVKESQKLAEMNKWIVDNGKPLFNLLIYDEAHHLRAMTWTLISQKLRPVEVNGPLLPNTLLLTATPYHAAGDLDCDDVRDKTLTPCTLIDAAESNPPIVKSVVFLEIQRDRDGQKPDECNLDVLKLVGQMLASKMREDLNIPHRALVLINKTEKAEQLLRAYNRLGDEKPQVRPGVPMVCETYFTEKSGDGVADGRDGMDKRLDRFRVMTNDRPVH